MSCSAVSNWVLNEPLSSDAIAPVADPFSFSEWAGNPFHCPEPAAVDGASAATLVRAV